MRRLLAAAACATVLLGAPLAHAKDAPLTVTVADPFISLHTGPGRGYPVTVVVAKGEQVDVLKRRTDWFKVRDTRGRAGWVHRNEMALTITDEGAPPPVEDPKRDDFVEHRREIGVLAGDFGGANLISAYGAYALNPQLAAELTLMHVIGNNSNGEGATLGLSHTFRPDWRIQPFVSMGTGVLRIRPKGTLVQTEDRVDQVAFVGAGLKGWLTSRFMMRGEYRKYVVFTDRDDNEEVNEWKLGFAFFF
jgi:hypothetical protein